MRERTKGVSSSSFIFGDVQLDRYMFTLQKGLLLSVNRILLGKTHLEKHGSTGGSKAKRFSVAWSPTSFHV